MKILIITVVVFLSGCMSSSGVVPIGKDTFMVSVSRKGQLTGSEVKADAFREANVYCLNQKKVLQVVNTQQSDMQPFRADASAEIQFMCLGESDPEVGRPKLHKAPDSKIEIKNDIVIRGEPAKTNDVYAELMKLDDLRKKGIITESEFEALKKKLLSGN